MKNVEEVLGGVKDHRIAGHIRPDRGLCRVLHGIIFISRQTIRRFMWTSIWNSPERFSLYRRYKRCENTDGRPRTDDLFVTCDVSAKECAWQWRRNILTQQKNRVHRPSCEQSGVCADQPHPRGDKLCLRGALQPSAPEKITRGNCPVDLHGHGSRHRHFQYSSTTPETMHIAGELMKTGFPFSKIIDESFTRKHICRIR